MSAIWGDVPSWSFDSVKSLMQTLKLVDPMTYEHCCRVGDLSRLLARDSGLNIYEQHMAEFAGLLHDIGKIGISQDIIAKPAKLTDVEYEIMKKHSEMSEQIIVPLAGNSSFFQDILPSVRGHHERVDGHGYPDKKRGDEIPLIARIILVVDTYDAMSETRAYRKGLPIEKVIAELQRCSGTQFDSQLVTTFIEAQKHWHKERTDRDTLLVRLRDAV